MAEPSYRYDTVPFESHPFAQSHPDRQAVIATLFGMEPAPVERSRILELGCACGGNLLPLAATLPESRCVGLEPSWVQASVGQAVARSLGLRNVDIRHQDLMAAADTLGTFDYIIAHGLYSWVPPEVQARILAICQAHLAPQGVAYISYNTYPGWHFRGLVRDLMLYHAGAFRDPNDRALQARAVLDFLTESVPASTALGVMLAEETATLRREADYYLLHDHLEENNLPVYFHQFASRAAEQGLQYLGEVEFHTMLPGQLPPEIAETLARLGGDIIRTEQFMDFIRNRPFRQTLLCRAEVELQRSVKPDRISSFHLASPAAATTSDDAAAEFVFNEAKFTTTSPQTRSAMDSLMECWPQSMPFETLAEQVKTRTGAVDREALAADMLVGVSGQVVQLRTFRRPFTTVVSDRPQASALARLQAQASSWVTNQLHETMVLNPRCRDVLHLVDGEHQGLPGEELAWLARHALLVG